MTDTWYIRKFEKALYPRRVEMTPDLEDMILAKQREGYGPATTATLLADHVEDAFLSDRPANHWENGA